MDNPVFAVIGGDERFALLASMLARDGYSVLTAGYDMMPDAAPGAVQTDAVTAAAMAGKVILPLPPTRGGAELFAPLSYNSIPLDDRFFEALRGAVVYTGQPNLLRSVSDKYAKLNLRDYYSREGLLILNAQLTAEAAAMLAVQHTRRSVFGCDCLITGYGRIGKALAPLLRSMGARVTVAARSSADLARVDSLGMDSCSYHSLDRLAGSFDLVINTVPAMVLGEGFIKNMEQDAVILDLASAPGGTDFDSAARREIKAVHALGLPGKFAPLTAARIIKDTVLEMTEEEQD